MTTYLELQSKVSRTLQDPDQQTFDPQTVKDMIAAAWAEVGLISPERFIEDLTPVDDQIAYPIRANIFPDGNDDIRLVSVEVWDATAVPDRPIRWIEAASSHPTGLSYSEAGWQFWGGFINLPYRWVAFLKDHEADYFLRVRGYSPWANLVDDADVVPFSAGIEEALVIYCYIEALRRLIGNRALFTQWQTRSNNTDVTPAALMNDLNIAQEEWRRKSRAILVLRESP